MDAKVVLQGAEDNPFARVDGYGAYGTRFDVVNDGMVYAHVSSHAQAMRVRDFYRSEFGGAWDIIESETLDVMGNVLFAGNPTKFSHVSPHVSSNVPMFDVYVRGNLVARNLTAQSRDKFIAALDDTDVTWAQYNPAENDAPVPQPTKMIIEGKFGNRKRVGRAQRVVVKELRYSAIPKPGKALGAKKAHTHYVLDAATLSILHSGNKMTGLSYMRARRDVGYKNHTMRVVPVAQYASYMARVHEDGYRVYHKGALVCTGTKDECKSYVTAGIVGKYITPNSVRVEKVVL